MTTQATGWARTRAAVDGALERELVRVGAWEAVRRLLESAYVALLAGLVVALLFACVRVLWPAVATLAGDVSRTLLAATAAVLCVLVALDSVWLGLLLRRRGRVVARLDALVGSNQFAAWWEQEGRERNDWAHRFVLTGLASETLDRLRDMDRSRLRTGVRRQAGRLSLVGAAFVASVWLATSQARAPVPLAPVVVASRLEAVAEAFLADAESRDEPLLRAVGQTLRTLAADVRSRDLRVSELEVALESLLGEVETAPSAASGATELESLAALTEMLDELARASTPRAAAADAPDARLAPGDAPSTGTTPSTSDPAERGSPDVSMVPSTAAKEGDGAGTMSPSSSSMLGVEDWEAAGGDEYFPPELARVLDRQRASSFAAMRVTLPPGGDPGGAGAGESFEAGAGRPNEVGGLGDTSAWDPDLVGVALPVDPNASAASRTFDPSLPVPDGAMGPSADSGPVPTPVWQGVAERPRYVENLDPGKTDAMLRFFGRDPRPGTADDR